MSFQAILLYTFMTTALNCIDNIIVIIKLRIKELVTIISHCCLTWFKLCSIIRRCICCASHLLSEESWCHDTEVGRNKPQIIILQHVESVEELIKFHVQVQVDTLQIEGFRTESFHHDKAVWAETRPLSPGTVRGRWCEWMVFTKHVEILIRS